jgi:zinc and cadmium transporter
MKAILDAKGTLMASYLTVILFSLIGGVFSLAGGVLLLSRQRYAALLAKYATPFAAGALLAAAFMELLPEAIEITAEGAATRWVLGGIIVFFLLEHFLHWFHHHHEHEEASVKASVPLIVIGDTLHNFIDGIAIGAAFLINIPAGIVATLAVATHEIPQEVGDFGLLLKSGLPKKKVLIINIASALMSTLGAVLTFSLGTSTALPLGELLAITAGLFIYIAASDLIPTIHETSKGKATYISALLLVAGVIVVGGATEIAHEYAGGVHSDNGGVCIVGTESPCNGEDFIDSHNSHEH